MAILPCQEEVAGVPDGGGGRPTMVDRLPPSVVFGATFP